MRSMAIPRRNHQTDSLDKLNYALGVAKGTRLHNTGYTFLSALLAYQYQATITTHFRRKGRAATAKRAESD